jgi:hypothetical protein
MLDYSISNIYCIYCISTYINNDYLCVIIILAMLSLKTDKNTFACLYWKNFYLCSQCEDYYIRK